MNEFKAFVTGYTYWDNTPPQSAKISHPRVHKTAGGTGTYQDPITLAVGHVITNGKSKLDFPAGTRFYLPYLKRYVIVEDTCGDGPRPQDIPCHKNENGPEPWIDLWLDGRDTDTHQAHECARSITGVKTVVRTPPPDLEVTPGPIC